MSVGTFFVVFSFSALWVLGHCFRIALDCAPHVSPPQFGDATVICSCVPPASSYGTGRGPSQRLRLAYGANVGFMIQSKPSHPVSWVRFGISKHAMVLGVARVNIHNHHGPPKLMSFYFQIRASWSPESDLCEINNIHSTKLNMIMVLTTDTALLLIMLIGLLRLGFNEPGVYGLRRLMWRQVGCPRFS